MWSQVVRSVAVCALAGGVSLAQAQAGFDAGSPAQVLELAKGYGSATLTVDSDGDPRIEGRMEGRQYTVIFYDCKGGKACASLQFAWAIERQGVSLERLNEWNRTKRFGKAFLDKDGDPRVEMDVNVAYGVTRKNLDDSFDYWRVVVTSFYDMVAK